MWTGSAPPRPPGPESEPSASWERSEGSSPSAKGTADRLGHVFGPRVRAAPLHGLFERANPREPERIAPGGRITALARLDYNAPRLDGYEVSLCYAGEDGALRCGTGCPNND